MDNHAKVLFDAKMQKIDSELKSETEQIKRRYESSGDNGLHEMNDRLGRAEVMAEDKRKLALFELEQAQKNDKQSTSQNTTVALPLHKWIADEKTHTGLLKLLSEKIELPFQGSYFGGLNEFFQSKDFTVSRARLKTGIAKHLQGSRKEPGQINITQWKSDLKDGHSEFFKYFDIILTSPDIYKLLPK